MKDIDVNSVAVVVLDTNILLQDPLLKGAHIQKLFAACQKCGITVVVPEIVRDELYGNHKHRISRSWQKLEKEHNTLCLYLTDSPPLTKLDIEHAHASYKEHVEDVLAKFDVQSTPYPPITAQQLVRASYENKKPFKQSGDVQFDKPVKDSGREGHKDYLVFHSLLTSLAGKAPCTCILVTANQKDFCDDAGSLHPDMQAHVPADFEVVVSGSAASVYEDVIAPLIAAYSSLEDAAAIVEAIKTGRFPGFNLNDGLESILNETLFGSPSADLSDVNSPLDDVSVAELKGFNVEGIEVSEIDKGSLVIDITGTLGLLLFGFLEKHEYFGAIDRYLESGVHVDDGDWNDYVVSAEFETNVDFALTMVFIRATQDVDSADMKLSSKEH